MATAAPNIEVGAAASDGSLRLWRAREAVRQAEAMLRDQTATMDQLRVRAVGILTWDVGAMLAIMAASTAQPSWHYLPAIILFSMSAMACLVALWPIVWHVGFYTFSEIEALQHQTELEILERWAQSLEQCVLHNRRATRDFLRLLRVAWGSFAAAPVVALAAAAASVVSR